jgi:hypothetical protein
MIMLDLIHDFMKRTYSGIGIIFKSSFENPSARLRALKSDAKSLNLYQITVGPSTFCNPTVSTNQFRIA